MKPFGWDVLFEPWKKKNLTKILPENHGAVFRVYVDPWDDQHRRYDRSSSSNCDDSEPVISLSTAGGVESTNSDFSYLGTPRTLGKTFTTYNHDAVYPLYEPLYDERRHYNGNSHANGEMDEWKPRVERLMRRNSLEERNNYSASNNSLYLYKPRRRRAELSAYHLNYARNMRTSNASNRNSEYSKLNDEQDNCGEGIRYLLMPDTYGHLEYSANWFHLEKILYNNE